MVKVGILIPKEAQNAIFSPESKKVLENIVNVVWNEKNEQLTEEEACSLLKGCEIAVSSWRTAKPTKLVLDSCPTIKLWEHAAGTVKGFFTDDIKGRDLIIASCAPAIGKTVAEMALGELIIGLRRIIPNSQQNETISGAKPDNKLYLSVSTIGVIGASRVGRYLLKLLQPFNVRILLYDPYITKEQARELGAIKVDTLMELCEQSDAVTMHTPNTKATFHMMGEEQFKAMKDDAVFINTSRGACVDEAALIAELKKGRLFAFLDVSDPEPADLNSPIRTLPNIIYTSHLAGGPSIHIGNQVVSDIQAYLKGQKLEMQVNWDMLETMA